MKQLLYPNDYQKLNLELKIIYKIHVKILVFLARLAEISVNLRFITLNHKNHVSNYDKSTKLTR